ncbi:peroxin-11C Pex11C-Penicillium chrysogenum [Penicillium manginii]|uniref:peroxin-11C Pex11C-Penicillium chrysogenum n=1 Tax=Penicillium manginii TaxID=203109 RepID=UPI00254820CF|nr:peroxin-11C Pex11C-Penicillium chrysogenum [Penicillium manginii]KAJ5756585.1 peroxin-11C Pex11C-Penicillium chrysogenum [Penicillium manginii]
MADPELPPSPPAEKTVDAQHVGNAPIAAGKPATRRQLTAALTAADVTIRRLDLLLSTADGQERVLATVNYVASILQHLCASAPFIAFQTRLSLLARLKGRSIPKSLSSATTGTPSPSKWAALSSLASETRYTIRLFGLLPLWIWGSETLKSPPADPIIRTLTYLQIISNVIYQLLENVGYLASKGIISKRFVEKYGSLVQWEIWSTRGWFGHIFFEFFVLWRRHILRKRRVAAKRAAAGNVETKEMVEEEDAETRAEIRSWRKSLVNNICWAPLCLHWCFEQGIGVPDNLVGVVSFMAGAWSLHDMWGATGKAIQA